MSLLRAACITLFIILPWIIGVGYLADRITSRLFETIGTSRSYLQRRRDALRRKYRCEDGKISYVVETDGSITPNGRGE